MATKPRKKKTSDWNRWQELVLDKLDEHGNRHKEHSNQLRDVQIEIAKLKTKATLWGGLSGFAASAGVILMKVIGSE